MPNYKFGKNKKITSKGEYVKIFSDRKFLHSNYFKIVYTRNNNTSKLGLGIAKKHHKLAVKRNTLKRIVREVFRTSLIGNYNIIVLSKKFAKVDNAILFNDLKILFSKLVIANQ